MAGIDRRTLRVLDGWPHVVQSIEVILTTRIGARVMRRTFGSAVPGLLGRPLTPRTILRYATAIIVALELWEPRFRIRQVTFPTPSNNPDSLRLGKLRIVMLGEYRPRAHLGDFTVESSRTYDKAAAA